MNKSIIFFGITFLDFTFLDFTFLDFTFGWCPLSLYVSSLVPKLTAHGTPTSVLTTVC